MTKMNKATPKATPAKQPKEKFNKKPEKRFRGVLDIQYNGSKMVETRVEVKNWTRNDIKEYMKKTSNLLKKKGFNGALATAVYYDTPEIQTWRAGYFTPVGDRIKLWSPDDSGDVRGAKQETFDTFTYYTINQFPKLGGDDPHNDCLYNALNLALPIEMKRKFKGPAEFKTYLGLERDDKVHIDLMPVVEELFPNHKVSVVGDYTYTSTVKAQLTINLSLLQGHFEFVKPEKCYKVIINYKEKPIMVYKKQKDRNCLLYDGKTKQIKPYHGLDKEIFRGYSKDYVYIKYDPLIKNKVVETIEQFYTRMEQDAEKIKKASKGIINIKKSGSPQNTALYIFDRFTKTITVEPLNQDEAFWIHEATNGAMIWADEYEGPAYKYDFCSYYPSILHSTKFMIPVKRGEFEIWTQDKLNEQTYYRYGIYHCKIHKDITNLNLKKVFRFNQSNYYTHFDMTMAKNIGLKMEIIDDGKPNVLLYSRDKLINSSWLFRDYVDILFKLKQEGITIAKTILNILWGLLSQRKMKKEFSREGKHVDIVCGRFIYSIKPDNNGTIMKTYNYNKLYKYPYVRIMPFLIAKGRSTLVETMAKVLNDIVWMHSDGFITTKKHSFYNMGNGLGQLKEEGYCGNCKIKNVIHKTGEFK